MEHLILMGPPGCGRTLYARRLTDAPGAFKHAVACDGDSARLRRAAGFDPPYPVDANGCPVVPFRAPHHTVSLTGMTGALTRGFSVRPGEISLAHGGILLLDEAAEFRQEVLDAVLSALKTGEVVLTGERGTRVILPAQFRLVIATHPCPCGYHGDPRPGGPKCQCSEDKRTRYLARLAPFQRHCRTLGPAEIRSALVELGVTVPAA